MSTDQVNVDLEVREWLEGLTIKCPGEKSCGELATVEVTILLTISLRADVDTLTAIIKVTGKSITSDAYSGLWASNGIEKCQVMKGGIMAIEVADVLKNMPDITLSFTPPT